MLPNRFKVEKRDANDRAALTAALAAHAGQRLRARDLKRLTVGNEHRPRGVPKASVRRLLTSVPGVTISKDSDGYWYVGLLRTDSPKKADPVTADLPIRQA
jgi:hypothetical protein